MIAVPAIPEAVDRCAKLARGGGAVVGLEGLPAGGLHRAAGMGDVARILQDVELGAARDQLDDKGRTPLAWAVLLDQRDAAIALLRNGASPDARLAHDETALMLAARAGNRPLIEALLGGGASPAAVDDQQRTALIYAAWHGRADAVDALSERSTTIGMTCATGMNALHYAALGADCVESIDVLLKRGALLEARDHRGATPLLRALQNAQVNAAQHLIKKGAERNVRDFGGFGAFDYVAEPRTFEGWTRSRTEAMAALKDALELLIDSNADRRLGYDTRTQPILFRAELDALAAREGRPPLPELDAHAATGPSARSAERAVTQASRRLLRKLQAGSMQSVAQLHNGLIFNRGWSRVPGIVRTVELRSIAPRGGQRLRLSGAKDGRADWSLSDVLLIESVAGSQRRTLGFIGAADDLQISGTRIKRLGRQANHFVAGELDVTETLSTARGADRVVITALDFGKGFSVSDLYLSVEGPGADETANRFEIEQAVAGRQP